MKVAEIKANQTTLTVKFYPRSGNFYINNCVIVDFDSLAIDDLYYEITVAWFLATFNVTPEFNKGAEYPKFITDIASVMATMYMESL